jgi:hypothetical protein
MFKSFCSASPLVWASASLRKRRRECRDRSEIAGVQPSATQRHRSVQLRSGSQNEKVHRIDQLRSAANICGLLLGDEFGIAMTQGWPRGCWGGCVATKIVVARLATNHFQVALPLHRDSSIRPPKRVDDTNPLRGERTTLAYGRADGMSTLSARITAPTRRRCRRSSSTGR